MKGFCLKVKSSQGQPFRPPQECQDGMGKGSAKKAHGRQGQKQVTNPAGMDD
jgi:hypothetical protein